MLFLLGGILCNVAILLVVRSFNKFGIQPFPGIVVNYFVAGSLALFFTSSREVFFEARHLWWPALFLGALFISVFYLISRTTEKMGVSVASVANKMSVVIPVVLAFALYGDSISLPKLAGILLALVSVVFVSSRKESGSAQGRAWLLPAAVFLGSGIIDAIVNFAQKRMVRSPDETACLTALFFYAAGTIGLLSLLLFYPRKSEVNWIRTLAGGIVLGTPNFFSIYLVMRAISENVLESSVLYPVVNVGVVLGSTLGALLFFREKLSLLNWIGVLCSITAIALITLV